MLIGYFCSGTHNLNVSLQYDRLKSAGCSKILEECPPGALLDRPRLGELLAGVQPADTIVVTSLFQLARSMNSLIKVVEQIKRAGAGLKSLDEPWADTRLPSGWMVFTVLSGMAQFKQSSASEKQSAGRDEAKQRGVRFGRPPSLTPEQVTAGRQLIANGTSMRKAAAMLGCHYASLFRALSRDRKPV